MKVSASGSRACHVNRMMLIGLILMGGTIRLGGLSAAGVAGARAAEFKLEPFTVLEYEGPLAFCLRMGQPVDLLKS